MRYFSQFPFATTINILDIKNESGRKYHSPLHFEGVGASRWDRSLRRGRRLRVWAIRLQPSWDLSSRSWQHFCTPENGAAAQAGRCDNSRNWRACFGRTRRGYFPPGRTASCHVMFCFDWLGRKLRRFTPPYTSHTTTTTTTHTPIVIAIITLVVTRLCFSKGSVHNTRRGREARRHRCVNKKIMWDVQRPQKRWFRCCSFCCGFLSPLQTAAQEKQRQLIWCLISKQC